MRSGSVTLADGDRPSRECGAVLKSILEVGATGGHDHTEDFRALACRNPESRSAPLLCVFKRKRTEHCCFKHCQEAFRIRGKILVLLDDPIQRTRSGTSCNSTATQHRESCRNGIQQAGGKIPPLAGEAFVKRWGARTTQALSTRIATAISGFPPAGLDDNTANNLAAYFLQVSGARAGTQKLGTPGTTEVLIREATPTIA